MANNHFILSHMELLKDRVIDFVPQGHDTRYDGTGEAPNVYQS